MAFKTKKEAIASIAYREKNVDGKVYPIYDAYLGVNCITKKQERLYARTKERLVEMIEDFYRARSQSGDLSSVLTPEQIVDARNALRMLAEAKTDVSLTECARREIERSSRVLFSSKTLGDAFTEYLIAKSLNSELEIKKTECTVGNWVNRTGRDRTVASITIEDVSEYVKTCYGDAAPRTYNSHVSYIKTFLSWCANPEQKFIAENPALPIRMKPVAWKKPQYMKPADVKRLFDLLWANRAEHPDHLALAVTQFFVGVRREEAIRMAENPETATVLLEDETFRVDYGKGHTKGVASRAAHLTENAVAWIRSFDYANAIRGVTEDTTTEYYALARAAGIPVFKNCARHTFITMHVARFHTPEVTQAMVGTSGAMRAVHYDGLAPQREGEEYFSILPPCAEGKEVA